ncbi:MAG TPA: acyl-CoA dehydrogenase [Gammaproteobacteria bacterium]|nr:acyl-CoA dehydrogenase [Gammaproteobacteria bacterium]
MTPIYANSILWAFICLAAVLGVAYTGASRRTWIPVLAIVLVAMTWVGGAGVIALIGLWVALIAAAVIATSTAARRRLLSDRVLAFYRKAMPDISPTERDALEAGTVWWEADMFRGRPRWQTLLRFPAPRLSAEERAFIDGPVERLCEMLDDWKINYELNDLPPKVWQFIKDEGFFGMIIPRAYGGKEFSNFGHASVVMRIATRSISAALTVMIPNSVGPGKLLLKYGTEEQKNHYLPRLARGEEVPCFALTGRNAGSDASGISDRGIVCRQEYEGRENVLGIRVNFDKRYITLGPIATVLGLAFKLEDPNHLLGEQENLGITLALVPANAPGVVQGERHRPYGMAFQNGPLHGRDVFVPMEQVIGGAEYAGKGWRMLMESLTDGRAISLPALSTAAAKVSVRVTGAYARLRSQFKVPIGCFEGVEEKLARIAANTYLMDAARQVTLSALDEGHKPSVVSAIMKYNLTERAREVVTDALDVHAGAGVCLGPNNLLSQLDAYTTVGVTVEGANILTRNLITFGQGALRCHPFLIDELTAANDEDAEAGAQAFDGALLGHIGYAIRNGARALLLGLSGGWLARAPEGTDPALASYWRGFERMSAAFAITTDLLLLSLRGELKRRERISARMADAISQLYLGTVTLKHYEQAGALPEDRALVEWTCADCLHTIQESLYEVTTNLANRPIAWLIRILALPLRRRVKRPADQLDRAIAPLIMQPTGSRDRLAEGMFLSQAEGDRLKTIDDALRKAMEAEPLVRKLGKQIRLDAVANDELEPRLAECVSAGLLSEQEMQVVLAAERLRRQVIAVDAFGDGATARAAEPGILYSASR